MTIRYDQIALALISFIVATTIAYRLKKRNDRRHTCGNKSVRRIKKLEENLDPGVLPGKGHYKTYVFGDCCGKRGCGKFYREKSEDKCFTPWEIWWRKVFHAHEFTGLAECLEKAGLAPRRFTLHTGTTFHSRTITGIQVPKPRIAHSHKH